MNSSLEKKENDILINKPIDNTKHSKPFYSLDEYPKFKILEENYDLLLKEFLSVMAEDRKKKKKKEDPNVFEPWVEKNLYQESNYEGWDVAPLMIGGNKIEDRYKTFPILGELTNKMSGIMSISYSLLKPGTHIVPHKGYDDYSEKVLRFHMGMIVPKGDIGIRVDTEIRGWENGKGWIFDDFLIHEAWNFSEKDRIVLIIDFLREEINDVAFHDKNFNNSIKTYFKK